MAEPGATPSSDLASQLQYPKSRFAFDIISYDPV